MKTIIFSIVFASVLAIGYGLQCFTCHPNKDAGKYCQDIDESVRKTCSAGETLCLTIMLDGQVTRDCFTGNKKEGCRESAKDTTKECYCSGDLCNGATKNYGIVSLVLPVIFTYFTLAN